MNQISASDVNSEGRYEVPILGLGQKLVHFVLGITRVLLSLFWVMSKTPAKTSFSTGPYIMTTCISEKR